MRKPVVVHRTASQVREELHACVGCNECLLVCPAIAEPITIDVLNRETITEAISAPVARFAHACFQCGACVAPCPVGLHRDAMMLWLKVRLLRSEQEEYPPMFNFRRASASLHKTEKGYSGLFFFARRSWVIGCLIALFVIVVSGAFYLWYNHYGDDLTPSGNIGLSYAIAGLVVLVLAAASYSVRRRLDTPAVGQLNRALNWHGFFALIGLALLLMHSFGSFAPQSETYTLLSMMALTLSGLLGHALDRILAWRIVVEAHTILTAEGEDGMETIIQEGQAQGAVMPIAQQQMAAFQEIQQAIRRERLYHSVIHIWRRVHIVLAFLTLGLTLWHLIVELPSLYLALFH